ncbi:hypothetical protein ACEQ8H_002634 [Pleosporales sp. CAS-2024a]
MCIPPVFNPKTGKEWLNSTYLSGLDSGIVAMTGRDYLKTNSPEHSLDAYWEDSHIDWFLEFLRRRYNKWQDVLICGVHDSNLLYQLATMPENEAVLFKEDCCEPLRTEIATKNILFLPVNNGFGQDAVSGDNIARGAHWSFIVVDRRDPENLQARYLDGSVGTTRRPRGGLSIINTEINGRAAGQVLCGLDILLNLKRGAHDARTLKFIPHMQRDDNYKGTDTGRCGPHMYALMEFLLRDKTRLLDPGLDVAFNTGAPSVRKARSNEMAFDSTATRQQLVVEIRAERRRQEDLQPENAVDNLTSAVLRDILTFDKLVGLVTASSTQSDSSGSRKKDEPREKGAGGRGGGGGGGGGGSGGGGGGGDGDGNAHDAHDADAHDAHGSPEIRQADLDKLMRNDNIYEDLPAQGDAGHAFARQMYIERLREEEKGLAEKAKVEKTAEMRRQGQRPDERTLYPIIQFPKPYTDLPWDFSDENEVSDAQLEEWVTANTTHLSKLAFGKKACKLSQRAALHALSGVDFDYEVESRLKDIWIRDPEVFSPDEQINQPPTNIIARRMKETYNDIFQMRQLVGMKKFATIPLTQSQREAIRDGGKHPSIAPGRTCNEYTDRAMLLVQNKQSFKYEPRFNLENFWVKDTNVFTAGHDFELVDGPKPKLLGELNADGIRRRMFETYEAMGTRTVMASDAVVEPTNGSDSNSSPQPDTPNNSKKRKRSSNASSTGTSSHVPATKKLKLSAPDFGRVPDSKLAVWLEHVDSDIANLLRSDNDARSVRRPHETRWALERMFGNTFRRIQSEIDIMDKANQQHSTDDDDDDEMPDATDTPAVQLSQVTLRTLRSWKSRAATWNTTPDTLHSRNHKHLRQFFDELLMKNSINGRDVVFPDYRNDESRWPAYYKKLLAEEADGEALLGHNQQQQQK